MAAIALPPLDLQRPLGTTGTHANFIFSPLYIYYQLSIYIYILIYLNVMIILKIYRKSGKALNLTIEIYILIYIAILLFEIYQ